MTPAHWRGEQSGYLHPGYAASFSELATPRELPACGGWILERPIPGSPYRDGVGCYPLFACRDWSGLRGDLPAVANDLVSVTLVLDPFGAYDEQLLRSCFELVRPYKHHFVTDLSRTGEMAMSRNHRRNIAKARERVEVEVCAHPDEHLDPLVELYAELRRRHGISGLRAFSREALRQQMGVPGLVMLRAVAGDETVGMLLWFIHGEVAYAHLGAASDAGYGLMASYALYDHSVEHLSGRVRWLDLGAGPGVEEDASAEGFRRFKRGWSTGTRSAYLCGGILQPDRYAQLARARDAEHSAFFPPYRVGEFG